MIGDMKSQAEEERVRSVLTSGIDGLRPGQDFVEGSQKFAGPLKPSTPIGHPDEGPGPL